MIIKVSQEFHFNGKGLWIGMEREIVPGIEEVAEYVAAHETLKEAFKAISGQTMTDYNTGVPSSTPAVIDYQKNTVKEMIQDCTTVDDLQRIGADASKYDLHNEWEQKYIELTKAG